MYHIRNISIPLFLFLVLSCSSQKNSLYPIQIYKSEIQNVSVQNLSYVEPIINMSIEEARESRTKFYFFKYTKRSFDSILAIENGIFDFKQKVSLAADNDLIKAIQLKLDSLIVRIDKTKSLEHIKMPSEFNSLSDYGIENILLTYSQPKFSKRGGSFLSGSRKSGNSTQTIESARHRFDSNRTYFFIFDILNRKLILYTYTNLEKSKTKTKQVFINYVKSILNTLESS